LPVITGDSIHSEAINGPKILKLGYVTPDMPT